MAALAMDMPAELNRLGKDGAVTVARGPLVILAHGLMAIERTQRRRFWISSAGGRMSAREAERALQRWQGKRRT